MTHRTSSSSRLALGFATAFALCATACSTDGKKHGSDDELTAIPFPSTIELDQGAIASLSSSAEDGTLRFDVAPEALKSVKVGSILVSGVGPHTPAGLLRAVLAVERSGKSLTLKTAQAPIQLAYKKLHVRFERGTAIAHESTPKEPLALDLGNGTYDETVPFDYVLFDGDADEKTTNDQIVIDGEIGGGFDYDLSLDVDWGGVDALPDVVTDCVSSLADALLSGDLPDCSLDALLPEAKLSFEVDPKVHANANVHGAAILEYEKEVDLASATLPPIVIGPLVFVPVVDLTAELHGGASAAFRTGIHGSAIFETSVTVSSKHTKSALFNKPKLKDTDLAPNETKITLHAEAKVGAGARLNVLLYGVTGPYATARAYGALEADALKNPCWSLHAGIDANLGVRVTSPALPLLGHVTLLDWHAPTLNAFDEELTSGTCDAPPDVAMLPPGSGADANVLARPTFTPWSRTFSAPVEGGVAGSPGNSVTFADFQRTIDGHYVRAGWGVNTLTKIDERGELVWARDLALEGSRLRVLRVRSTSDAALVVASSAVTAPIVLAKLSQDGTVVDGRAFDIPLDLCTVTLTALEPDGKGGLYVAGSCTGTNKSFLMHAAERDAELRLFDVSSASALRVNVAANIEGDAFLSGSISDPNDAMFALRLTPEGKLAYARRYMGCAEAPDAIPSQAIVGARGEVTLGGSGGAQHNGIVIKLRADGSVGFARSPGFGFGVGSVFLLDSIAELPTTGFVAGGSAVRFVTDPPDNVPSAALIGFDAGGKVLWANRYAFRAGAEYTSSGLVGIHLTDDGGVMATALVADPKDALGGYLWAFKARAKDGRIAFAPNTVEVAPLDISNLACSLTASDLDVTIEAHKLAARSVVIDASSAMLMAAKQTGQ